MTCISPGDRAVFQESIRDPIGSAHCFRADDGRASSLASRDTVQLFLFMRSLLLSVFVGLFACLISSGCATVIKGSNQTIPISSDPSGAAVFADGNRVGSTPTSIELTRKHSHVITLEMRGYESENITLKPSMGGAVAGNILAGGLIGWGVDATTGAQYNLHPQEVNVRLRQKTAETTTAPQKSVSGLLAELEKLDVMKASGKISAEEYARLRESVLQQYSSK